jgi:hypothetical protein
VIQVIGWKPKIYKVSRFAKKIKNKTKEKSPWWNTNNMGKYYLSFKNT